MRCSYALSCLLLGFNPSVVAQPPVPAAVKSSIVFGLVKDAATALPLSGVHIVSGSVRTSADKGGRYSLVLGQGEHVVRFSSVGYRVLEKKVVVESRDSIRLDVALVPVAVLLGEVTVLGERSARTSIQGLGALSVSPTRLESVSGPFEDAYRMIQTMASVASNNEMSSQFNVRGGAADENLVLLNGAELLEPFHLKESPNTSVSIVNMDLLKKALFVPGGFTARYGDRLSAVLDLEYREGNREHAAAVIDGSLVNAAATVESPLSTWGSGLISVRSTYSDYVSKYLSSGDQRRPSYYDVHAVLGGDLDEQHHLTLQVLHASDKASGLVTGGYHTSLISIGSSHNLSDQSVLVSGLSLYNQYEDLTRSVSGAFPPLTEFSDISLWDARVQLESRVSPVYSLTAGATIQDAVYDMNQQDVLQGSTGDSLASGSLDRRGEKLGAYVENLFQFTDALLINGGLRFDYAGLTDEGKLSPRLLAAYRLPGGTTLKAAWGVYYQTPNHHQLLAAERDHRPFQHMQKAMHYVLGLEQPLRDRVSLRVDGYIKTLTDLISYYRRRSGDIVYSSRNDAKGQTIGLEMEMTIEDDRVMAWINVALMRAREDNYYDGEGWHFSPTDQTKTVTTVFEYRIADRWLLNLRALYGSGFAYGNDLPGVVDKRLHYPDYKRADARVSYSFAVGPAATTAYLEIMNLFAQRNVFSFTGQLQAPDTPDFNLLLPTVVNAGIRVKI